MKQSINFTLSRFRRLSDKTLSAILTVKSKKPLIHHMIYMTELVVGSVNRNWVKLLVLLLKKIRRLYKAQGLSGTVKYLKTCAIIVQQIAANHHIHDITPLGPRISRSKGGLPRIFPVEIRSRFSDPKIQKWILTVLSVFRVMVYPSAPKFSTITDPSTACLDKFKYLERHIPNSLESLGFVPTKLDCPTFSEIYSASPTSNRKRGEYSTHPRSILNALITLPKFGKVWGSLLWFVSQYPSVINKVVYYGHLLNDSRYSWWTSDYIGRLGLKQEPAGKVRVFSYADPLSQWVLKPLHRYIFKKLKDIPMDGTFNQLRPLSRVPWLSTPMYSLDLSAATDRLPIEIQFYILKFLFGPSYAQNWKTLLVDRSYHYRYKNPKTRIIVEGHVEYRVGQPMGLLSSWAMLALTHHVVVQIAAKFAGRPLPFRDYGLLGDDIVIWCRGVSKWYLKIMIWLGVDINLSKSIISKNGLGLEFAKKTIVNNIDVSPIPLKEYFATHDSSASLVSFISKYQVPLPLVKKIIGLGYKSSTSSKRYKMLQLVLTSPTNVGLFKALLLEVFKESHLGSSTRLSFVFSSWYKIISDLIANIEKDIVRIDTYLHHYNSAGLPGFIWGLGPEWTNPPKNYSDPRPFLEFLMKEFDEKRIAAILRAREDLVSLLQSAKKAKSSVYTIKRYLISALLVERFNVLSSWSVGVWAETDRFISVYFQLEERYSTLQVKRLLNPTPEDSVAAYRKDIQRLNRLWNRWSAILMREAKTIR